MEMNTLRLVVFLAIVSACSSMHAQSDWRLTLPLRLEGGGNFARMESDSGATWRQSIGSALTFGSGLGFRYKDRFGGSLEFGVLIDAYNYTKGPVDYSIAYVGTQFRANLHMNLPRKRPELAHWRIDLDGGYTPFDNTESKTSTEFRDVTIRTDVITVPRIFVAPGIGFASEIKQGEISFVVTYNYHFGSDPTLRTTFEEVNASATAAAKSDYFGARFRFVFDVAGHKPYQNLKVKNPEDWQLFEGRTTRVKKELEVKRERLVLSLWDNAEIDGDTISVMVNGSYILTNHPLTSKKKRLKIKLDSGSNLITIFAHNEGEVSPNTAACRIRSGLRKESFIISTGLDRNEAIEIIY